MQNMMDLDEIRQVAARIDSTVKNLRNREVTLTADVRKLKNNKVYLPTHIASESQRLREKALKDAIDDAASLQVDISRAREGLAAWTPRSVLNRAVYRDDHERGAAERMRGAPSARIQDIFTEATTTGQWALVGACLDEIELRVERATGTEHQAELQRIAWTLQSQLERTPNIPGRDGANGTAVLDAYLHVGQGWIDSTLRSIRTGEFDTGLFSQASWDLRDATPEERRAKSEELLAKAHAHDAAAA